MRTMTGDEVRRFLMTGTRTGMLGVTMADGQPHVTPIWFVLDGDDLVFSTWHTSVKARAMRRDPRVSLAVDDQQPPYSYVHIRGTVTITDDPEALLPFSMRIGGRYMGDDRAEEFGRRNAVEGELLVRLTPDTVVAHADMAG